VSEVVDELQAKCAKALEEHLTGGAEAALHSGYELGRRALGEGLGVLDFAALLHRTVTDRCLRVRSSEGSVEVLRAADNFLLECLSPFEMAYRGARDANAALRHINELLEEETRRIARELHDEAGQLLAGVYLALDDIVKDVPQDLATRLAKVRGYLGQIEMHLRRLAHELRPTILDDLGLLPALEFLAEGFAQRSAIKVTVSGACDERLPARVENAFYRVVQEALTNAGRHARASRVTVDLRRRNGQITCSVRDDGIGFDPDAILVRGAHGLGLLGMRERLAPFGGTLEIHSAPGRGTEVRVAAPVEASEASGSRPARPARAVRRADQLNDEGNRDDREEDKKS
jgi:signal transduction histidine kinase